MFKYVGEKNCAIFQERPSACSRSVNLLAEDNNSVVNQGTTVLVTLAGTDLTTLPRSQNMLVHKIGYGRIPQNNIERRREAGEEHFLLGCEVSQLNLTRTVGTHRPIRHHDG